MSVYQSFPNSEAALAAFELGQCRRHVRIDGHVIDLVQAAHPVTPSRPEYEEPRETPALDPVDPIAVAPEPSGPLPICPCCLRPIVSGAAYSTTMDQE